MEIRGYDTTGNEYDYRSCQYGICPRRETVAYGFSTLHGRNSPLSERIRRIRREEFFQFPDSLTKAKKEDLLRPVNIFLVEYNFATDGSLCARQSWANIWTKNHSNRIDPYLQDSIVDCNWNGNKNSN